MHYGLAARTVCLLHRSQVFEVIMIRTQYTTEDLKKLPLRAIVAFAARCARRVEPIAQFPAGDPQQEAHRVAIDDAIRLAEEIARGSARASSDPVIRALDATRSISGEGIGCGTRRRFRSRAEPPTKSSPIPHRRRTFRLLVPKERNML